MKTELTAAQAAHATGISKRLLWRLLVDGRVTGHQTSSRRWFVDASVLPHIRALSDELQRFPANGPRPQCREPDCSRPFVNNGMCHTHDQRARRARRAAQRAAELDALVANVLADHVVAS